MCATQSTTDMVRNNGYNFIFTTLEHAYIENNHTDDFRNKEVYIPMFIFFMVFLLIVTNEYIYIFI